MKAKVTRGASAQPRLTLAGVVERLHAHYGAPAGPVTSDPFELVLLENVAYLASPERRREALEALRSSVGLAPPAILKAGREALERVTARGILKRTFADKLRECARLALEEFGGDLGGLLSQPLGQAKRALQRFPGIGEPGAEKILLFTGHQALLAPESNGLRVLVRIGLVDEQASYARTYAASRQAAETLSASPGVLQEAHLLLQQHGRTLCRRAAPHCDACPLVPGCAYAQRQRRQTRRETPRSRAPRRAATPGHPHGARGATPATGQVGPGGPPRSATAGKRRGRRAGGRS